MVRSMYEFIFSNNMFPFTLALALVLGLLVLEVIALLLGGSLLGSDSDGFDVDSGDLDFDIDTIDADADFEIDIDSTAPEQPGLEDAIPSASTGWFGLGKVPIAIWVASLLTGFGLSGFIIQSILRGAFDWTMPALLAVPLAALPALWFVEFLSNTLARLIPKTETTAMSRRHMGSQHGVITQGNARRGQPAECRIRDRHGNLHYLRVEPLEDDATLTEGTEVYVIRRRNGTFRAVEITID